MEIFFYQQGTLRLITKNFWRTEDCKRGWYFELRLKGQKCPGTLKWNAWGLGRAGATVEDRGDKGHGWAQGYETGGSCNRCGGQARSNENGKNVQKALGVKWTDPRIWKNKVRMWVGEKTVASVDLGPSEYLSEWSRGRVQVAFGHLAETKWFHANQHQKRCGSGKQCAHLWTTAEHTQVVSQRAKLLGVECRRLR